MSVPTIQWARPRWVVAFNSGDENIINGALDELSVFLSDSSTSIDKKVSQLCDLRILRQLSALSENAQETYPKLVPILLKISKCPECKEHKESNS